jgi:hypothetical protein
VSNINSPAFDVRERTYCGPLSDYTFVNSEIGNLWEWIKAIANKDKVYFIDNLWWDSDLPADIYDCYVVGVFGEFANTNFLEQLNQRCTNSAGYVLTSIKLDPNKYGNLTILPYEHLQQYKTFFPETKYTPLSQRHNLHSILTRRVDFHKTIFTAALLNKCPTVDYSFCFFASKHFDQEYFYENYKNYLNIDISQFTGQIDQLLTQGAKIYADAGQWSIEIPAYQDTVLHWVNEAIFLSIDANPTGYLTEKTIKPIVSGTPFILLSQKNSYDRLTRLGFDTYSQLFDLDWDTAQDHERANSILTLMDSCSQGIDLKIAQEIADYNYNHFYNHLDQTVAVINQRSQDLLLENLA